MKKLDTLFHSTSSLEILKDIVSNGFTPSYAKEKIGDRNVMIAMVSFSNIPIIEARTQVNYGEYSIGLKRSWGMENKLHPVTYTYKDSEQEFLLTRLIQDFALFQVAPSLSNVKMDIDLIFEGFSGNFVELFKATLKSENVEEIRKYFGEIFKEISDLQIFFKHYIDTNKEGEIVHCFNDREWRFIPEVLPKLIFQSDVSGENFNQDYLKYSRMPKPHLRENSLNFELDDVEFIMVKENIQVRSIVDTLKEKFTEEKVNEAILNGSLTVFSFEKLYNSI